MIPYIIAGAIGFVVAKLFEDDEAPKYADGGLIAPNGKQSNLTPEQYKLVRTNEFKAWFGDWENDPANASKVVDENGEPLMVFHGTNRDFNVFDERTIGTANDRGFYGRGFYFTFQSDFKDKHYAINEALYYGKKLLNCYIKAINPFDFSILSMYKNKRINYIGAESLVFLTNISILFPQIADKIFIEKNTWNKFRQEYDTDELPISILPNLVTKYAKDLKLIETNGQFDRKETMGYVKSELVKYEYTDKDGKQVADQYVSYDDLGRVQSEISKEEKEILFIELAIEKYEGISIEFRPEGYMTRNSIITDAIKEKHDCILQSKYGDELVVFQPNQIKLADGTNTTFGGNNPDIRYAKGGDVNELKNYLRNIRLDEWYMENEIMDDDDNIEQYKADFGRKGTITYRIYSNKAGNINSSIYISSIDRGTLDYGVVQGIEGKKDSRGEGAKAIASLFLLYPNVDSFHYEDESYFDNEDKSFWKKIGGDSSELFRKDFFRYFENKFGYNPDIRYAGGGELKYKNEGAYAVVTQTNKNEWHLNMIKAEIEQKGYAQKIMNKIIEDAKNKKVKKITLDTSLMNKDYFEYGYGFEEKSFNDDDYLYRMELNLN